MRRIKHIKILTITGALFFLLTTCQTRLPLIIQNIEQINRIADVAEIEFENRCGGIDAYMPDENMPLRWLRVNLHFMNAADSTFNYNGEEAKTFGRAMIEQANYALANNQPMWLPRGNSTAVLPTRYRYVLTSSQGYEQDSAIYCHYDSHLFWFVSRGRNRNNYNRDVIKQYGIGLDSIINLFVMPHHPDSVLSESYKVTTAGIALGSGVKLSGIFETKKEPWAVKGLINHEIGHVLGLRHTWNTNDGCDDTPRNLNCWNKTLESPCDTAASNNLMDYNANQHAWTPCQLGKIHRAMSRETGLVRELLVPAWCRRDTTTNMTIIGSEIWDGARDLTGDLIISSGATLIINCRVSIPPGGQIIVENGATLKLHNAKLHNACGQEWQGIKVYEDRRNPGQVVYTGDTLIEDISIRDGI